MSGKAGNHEYQPTPPAFYCQGTKQKRQRARFRFLAALMEGMMETVLIVNPKTGLVEYANKAALKMFDCRLEDVLNHPPDIFCHWENRLKFHEEVIRSSLKESGWEGEIRGVRKNGEPFTSWLRAFSLKNRDGLPWVLAIVQRDLTAEKSLDGQFLQTGKYSAVEQKAREIAHEFNNLTTILYGYIDFMLRKEGLTPELEKDLKTIHGIGQKATLIARQLLNLSQPPEKKRTVMELAPLIHETLRIVSQEFENQGIQAEIIHHQPTSVLLDPAQISQVLLNLCINAQQAMAETPKKVLRIETGQEEGFAFLKISDTGCGISTENQHKIFQPFFTTKEVTAEGEKGLGHGLGLVVVKKIVEDHGGTITVQSSAGNGTVFTVYLPLSLPDVSREETYFHPKDFSFPGEDDFNYR
ncbi:MAG: ATP-binding protein [bacterium]